MQKFVQLVHIMYYSLLVQPILMKQKFVVGCGPCGTSAQLEYALKPR